MSLETCVNCEQDFLTEADDYVVTPIEGYALRCIKCYFKNKITKEDKVIDEIASNETSRQKIDQIKLERRGEPTPLRDVAIDEGRRCSMCNNWHTHVKGCPLEHEVLLPPKAMDKQVGGDHYKSMAIQPIEFIHKNTDAVAGNAG